MDELIYDDVPYFNFDKVNMKAKVLRIYDGDTIICAFEYNNKYYKHKFRLRGIDTPEIKDGSMDAFEARNTLIKLITSCNIDINDKSSYQKINNLLKTNNKYISINCFEYDKYGRILADIYVEDNNSNEQTLTNVNEYMLRNGLAKKYEML